MSRGKGYASELPAGRDDMRRAAYILTQEIRKLEEVLSREQWERFVYEATYKDLQDSHRRLTKIIKQMKGMEWTKS